MDDPRLERLIDWLKTRNEGLSDIGLDDDLIDSRLIDSLAFLEFVFLIEELTDRQDLLDEITVDSMRTLRSITESYLIV